MKHEIKIVYDDESGNVQLTFNHKAMKKDEVLAVLWSAPLQVERAYKEGLARKKSRPKKTELEAGAVVVVKCGPNAVTGKPFQYLYEFGHYTEKGCIVYGRGKQVNAAIAVKMDMIRAATEMDKKKIPWGK